MHRTRKTSPAARDARCWILTLRWRKPNGMGGYCVWVGVSVVRGFEGRASVTSRRPVGVGRDALDRWNAQGARDRALQPLIAG